MKNSSIKYGIYQSLYTLGTEALKMIPFNKLLKKESLTHKLQIGVSTYIDRYEMFFKPLYKNLLRYFPDAQVSIAINGFYNLSEQSEYIQRVNRELCGNLRKGVTFILHDKPVGLTRLWNEILCQSDAENTLMLNDDLQIAPWFRVWLEKCLASTEYITLLNGSWSHFLISQNTISKVGWFDEGFEGIGFEDMDYTARCMNKRVTIANLRCAYIKHSDHKPLRTSFDKKSETTWGVKYSSINHDYFFKKWTLCKEESGIYIKQLKSYVKPSGYQSKEGLKRNLHFTDGIAFPDRTI